MAFISSGNQQPIGCIFNLKGYQPTSNSITISFYTENMDESLVLVRKAGERLPRNLVKLVRDQKIILLTFRYRGNRIGLFTRNIHPGE